MKNNNDEIARVTYITTDYDKFNFFEINRTANVRKQLVEDMEANGRFFQPIIVDSDFNVYDGQHRLLVAEHLEKPIEYIIDDNIKPDDIPDLNTSSKNWTIEDFIKSYARKGNEHYQKLYELENHSMTKRINKSVVRAIALNKTQSGANSRKIKEGNFKFHNYKKTVRTIELLNSFSTANRGGLIKEKLGNAILRLTKINKINNERLIQIAGNPENTFFTEYAYGSVENAMKDLINEYNKGLRDENNRINFAILNDDKFEIIDNQTNWKKTGLK